MTLNGKWRGYTRMPNCLFRVFAGMISGLCHELQMGSRLKENGVDTHRQGEERWADWRRTGSMEATKEPR
jgi:hypothetical protein